MIIKAEDIRPNFPIVGWKHFALLAFVILAFSGVSKAATLGVQPTILQITTAQRTALLTLENHEDVARTYRIRVYRWRQNGFEQTTEATSDLVVSPPIVTLRAGQIRTVRVRHAISRAAARKQAGDVETSYRLVLEQRPSGASASPASGLNLLLRISLPVFVRPNGSAAALQLNGKLSFDSASARIEVSNDGKSTARIVRAILHSDAGQDSRDRLEITDYRYILPTGRSNFVFPVPDGVDRAALAAGSLTLQTDQGDIEVPLTAVN